MQKFVSGNKNLAYLRNHKKRENTTFLVMKMQAELRNRQVPLSKRKKNRNPMNSMILYPKWLVKQTQKLGY